MKTQVIDQTNPSKKPKNKPIQLSHCLQYGSLIMTKMDNISVQDFQKIERVATVPMNATKDKSVMIDVFKVTDPNNYEMLMLGHWNDGVLG